MWIKQLTCEYYISIHSIRKVEPAALPGGSIKGFRTLAWNRKCSSRSGPAAMQVSVSAIPAWQELSHYSVLISTCCRCFSIATVSKTHWSVEWFPAWINRQVQALNPDIIHLHWICRGFIDIPALASFQKTGGLDPSRFVGLHRRMSYPRRLQVYKERCGCCPQLGSKHAWDLSRWTWNRKQKFWRDMHLTIVTPSQWLADCARSSSLLRQRRIDVIHNGIDLNQYRPVEKKVARAILGLPQERKLVLFSAMNATYDLNKGFRYLEAALRQLG